VRSNILKIIFHPVLDNRGGSQHASGFKGAFDRRNAGPTVEYPVFRAPNGSECSGYVIAPGVIVGLMAAVLISGNPHGGSTAEIVLVADAINFVVFVGVSYLILQIRAYRVKRNSGSKS
jgi:hypothetical protein